MMGRICVKDHRPEHSLGDERWLNGCAQCEIERLYAELDRQREVIRRLNLRCDHLGIRLGEVIRERDAALEQPERTHSQKLADAGFTRRPSLWAWQARAALELIAAPMRPDGTWNRDREACMELAAETLGRTDDKLMRAGPRVEEKPALVVTLPPLPEPLWGGRERSYTDAYSANQMRDYGSACLRAAGVEVK